MSLPSRSDASAVASLDRLRAEALQWGKKPRKWGTFYVAEHIVRAMRAYGWTIVAVSLGQPIVYLFGLVIGLAALIAAPIDDGGALTPYLVFVAPALLMSSAISVASEEFTYPVMGGFKWRRYYYGFSASPISPAQIANGVVLGTSARIVFTAVMYFGFAAAFIALLYPGMIHWATAWLCIPIAILAGLAFGVPLMAYASSIEDDKGQFALVQRFIFMPMFLFSGTFYPLTVLPVWLQWIGWVSPLWHASELGRWALYDKPVAVGMLVLHLGYLLVLTIGGLLIARRIFARRLGQ